MVAHAILSFLSATATMPSIRVMDTDVEVDTAIGFNASCPLTIFLSLVSQNSERWYSSCISKTCQRKVPTYLALVHMLNMFNTGLV